jgi:hypothetical protein
MVMPRALRSARASGVRWAGGARGASGRGAAGAGERRAEARRPGSDTVPARARGSGGPTASASAHLHKWLAGVWRGPGGPAGSGPSGRHVVRARERPPCSSPAARHAHSPLPTPRHGGTGARGPWRSRGMRCARYSGRCRALSAAAASGHRAPGSRNQVRAGARSKPSCASRAPSGQQECASPRPRPPPIAVQSPARARGARTLARARPDPRAEAQPAHAPPQRSRTIACAGTPFRLPPALPPAGPATGSQAHPVDAVAAPARRAACGAGPMI